MSALVESEALPDGTTVELPDQYTIVARRGPEAIALSDMKPEIIGQVAGGLIMDFATKDTAIRIRTELAFSDERLRFDPLQGIGFTPDRSNSQFIRYEIDVLKFSRCILSNGHLEVWDQENEALLGQSDTYIPVNCFVNSEFYEAEIDKLEKLLGK